MPSESCHVTPSLLLGNPGQALTIHKPKFGGSNIYLAEYLATIATGIDEGGPCKTILALYKFQLSVYLLARTSQN